MPIGTVLRLWACHEQQQITGEAANTLGPS